MKLTLSKDTNGADLGSSTIAVGGDGQLRFEDVLHTLQKVSAILAG